MGATLTRRRFLKRTGTVLLGTGLTVAGVATYAQQIEPRWVELRPVELHLPRLASEFDGYRVVQLSDLHLDNWRERGRLLAVMAEVNRQRPDLVVITGDFVSHSAAAVADDLVAGLQALRPRDGVVAVMGNHDHWSNIDLLRDLLRASGVTELANDVRTIERGAAILNVAGVDDVWQGKHRLERVMERLPAEGAALLLAHEPDYADVSAATGRFDLQLSGHSHGGQVVVPLVGAPVLPPLARKYPSGQYQVGSLIQYTNRGVGAVGVYTRLWPTFRPLVRLNCRPEVTVLTLRSRAAGGLDRRSLL